MSSFTIRQPLDVVVLVPHVMGFIPTESVVMLTLGPQAGFHSRIDLPHTRAQHRQVAQLMCEVLTEQQTTMAALVVYTEQVKLAEEFARRVAQVLRHADIDLVASLRVQGNRFFRLGCADMIGTEFDFKAHPFSAARVFEGHRVYESRAAYAATLAPTTAQEQAAIAAVIDQLDHRYGSAMASGAGGKEWQSQEWQSQARWMQDTLTHWNPNSPPLSLAEAARMTWLVTYGALRELTWTQLTRTRAAQLLPLWCDLLRRVPASHVPEVAAITAFVAWLSGDGALAWCALDRQAAGEREVTLAQIVRHFLMRAVSPASWRRIDSTQQLLDSSLQPRGQAPPQAS